MTDSRPTPDPLFLSFQTALAGRYSIDRELGRGGIGVVYLAREVHLDRLVAIKLLPPVLSVQPALRSRFLREAQLAAGLSHPHIIPIHAVLETDGFVYYVMAFVDGETLAQRVEARGPVSATDGIRLLREVAWALGYAHSQGLVHRDVKPDNILIETSTGRALVADFGIAAAAGDALNHGPSGTPEFMSPEQALGAETDARSDLYSLGATAFYALSGRLPFEGATSTEIPARQVTAPAPSLASVGAVVPRKLAQLIDACLAKEPSGRPVSAGALADGLSLALEQRRELPAALRAFVKRNGRMDGGGTIISLLGALVASVAVSAFNGRVAGVGVLAASAAIMPVAFGIAAARRLLEVGFTQTDLAPAFRAELDSSREECGIDKTGWSVRHVAESGLTHTAAVAGFGSLVLMQLRHDVDIEFWNRVWTGRFGRIAFLVARRLRGTKPMGRAVTHRATELSLGLATEGLFESLPKTSRDSLGDLPGLLQRLQRDAGMLRLRYQALQDAIGQAGTASTTNACAALRDERDLVFNRMRDTVGAMETIRLSLLRLHAGSLSLEALTTHIGLAAVMSADVERLVAAQLEVEELLRLPESIELTPV